MPNQDNEPVDYQEDGRKNKTILSAALLLILLLASFSFAFFVWRRSKNLFKEKHITQKNQQEVSIDETANETANWQTYRNEEYGFEFKYPIKWILTGFPDEDILRSGRIALFQSPETLKLIKESKIFL